MQNLSKRGPYTQALTNALSVSWGPASHLESFKSCPGFSQELPRLPKWEGLLPPSDPPVEAFTVKSVYCCLFLPVTSNK